MQSTGLAHAEYMPSSGCSLSSSPLEPDAVEPLPELVMPELLPEVSDVSEGSEASEGSESDSSDVVESDEEVPEADADALAEPDALVNVVGSVAGSSPEAQPTSPASSSQRFTSAVCDGCPRTTNRAQITSLRTSRRPTLG